MMDTLPQKLCATCQHEFPCTADYFHHNGNGYFHPDCKPCRSKNRSKHRKEHPELYKEIDRQRNKRYAPQLKVYKQQEYVKEKARQYTRAYNQREEVQAIKATPTFREGARQRYKKHWHTNPLAKIKHNARKRAHPAWRKASDHRRRAHEQSAEGAFTHQELMQRYEQQEGKCFYCGVEVFKKFHADHFIPLVKGGTNFIENIVIACVFCNCSKGTKYPWEWMPSKFQP